MSADAHDKAGNIKRGEGGSTDRSILAPPLPGRPSAGPAGAAADDAAMAEWVKLTGTAKEARALSRMKLHAATKVSRPGEADEALEWLLMDAGLSPRRAWDVCYVVDTFMPGLLSSDDLAGLLLNWRRKGGRSPERQLLLPGVDSPGLPDRI